MWRKKCKCKCFQFLKIILEVLYYSSHISFGVESAESMQQQALINVVAKNLYNQDVQRTPVAYGVLDRRLVSIEIDILGPYILLLLINFIIINILHIHGASTQIR